MKMTLELIATYMYKISIVLATMLAKLRLTAFIITYGFLLNHSNILRVYHSFHYSCCRVFLLSCGEEMLMDKKYWDAKVIF